VASAPSTASRSPETVTRAPGSAPQDSQPAVDVTAITSRDDFLLELGQALGGQAAVRGVLRYGEPTAPCEGGLWLLEAPGNDGVSSTALVASGATLLLFTTGRGTPLGFPAPTLKISSNTTIAAKKPHWIDLNAGALLDGTATLEQLEEDLFGLILEVASGRKLASNERQGYREIAIWKEGVTL